MNDIEDAGGYFLHQQLITCVFVSNDKPRSKITCNLTIGVKIASLRLCKAVESKAERLR